MLLIPTGYLIISYSIDIFKTLKESEEASSSEAGSTSLNEISNTDRERLKKQLLEEMMNKKKENNKNE